MICSFLHYHVRTGHISQLVLRLDTLTDAVDLLEVLLPLMRKMETPVHNKI